MRILFIIFIMQFTTQAYSYDNAEYQKKIQDFYNKQPLCLGPTKWPVSVIIGNDLWLNAKMESFVESGLAFSHLKSGEKIWELSRNGKHEFSKGLGFCYGKIKVKSIENIYTNNQGITIVEFKYLINNLPAWAKNKSIRFSNTDLDNIISGIDNVRYQAIFKWSNRSGLTLYSEPEQVDLLY
ncbi:hypothetical protein [Providencia burhodogranariea]|uniref:CpmK protein n=1 Tax=Providencia burhodogranariea DSM 19968 TaxID=1141662 RepID=K8WQP3_9GAMM|nr:hypothetical protein [Providencia burhodogranariea]EKT62919.1 hypothetical protein OOA_05566 [Providencia burhodogranariea DSM 19968]